MFFSLTDWYVFIVFKKIKIKHAKLECWKTGENIEECIIFVDETIRYAGFRNCFTSDIQGVKISPLKLILLVINSKLYIHWQRNFELSLVDRPQRRQLWLKDDLEKTWLEITVINIKQHKKHINWNVKNCINSFFFGNLLC